MHIVCYAGGTCGDLVSAMIDPSDVRLAHNTVQHHEQRQRLKKPHQFSDDRAKDQYLSWASGLYRSIPSHDLDYHLRRQHEFIAITVQDFSIAMWAAERFRKLHRDSVWQEMQRRCGASSVADYAQILIDFSNAAADGTKRLLKLESILLGQAADDLAHIIDDDVSCDIYNEWLTKQ